LTQSKIDFNNLNLALLLKLLLSKVDVFILNFNLIRDSILSVHMLDGLVAFADAQPGLALV